MLPSVLSLAGTWALCCDPVPICYSSPPQTFPLTMSLPGTTAQQAIGTPNPNSDTGYLTERYPFAGQIWLRRTVRCPSIPKGGTLTLTLERTRRTILWVNGLCVGGQNSLCTPHCYDLTPCVTDATDCLELVLCVSNIDYPTRGGHMTAPDTQTNWIGVTGALTLTCTEPIAFAHLRAFPNAAAHTVTVTGHLTHAPKRTCRCQLQAVSFAHSVPEQVLSSPDMLTLATDAEGAFSVCIALPDAPLWSETSPVCVRLTLTLPETGAAASLSFGMRDLAISDRRFTVNGTPIFLRGKHDALVFPLEGAAPTTLAAWLRVFAIAKEWGINHYRFHTCCPPEACFAAADLLGLYLMPELPFWGTIHGTDEPEYPAQAAEQSFLLQEGLRILETFGNHPSFCFFSLGNELWGSPDRLNAMLATLKAADPRPFYTQGSNNFQHHPLTVPLDDFWSGVRLGKGKLLRGSFATCDAPLGRVQTDAPATDWDYEALLCPQEAEDAVLPELEAAADGARMTTMEIQYETGVKTVTVEETKPFHPTIPVVTHEIGQYSLYPDFSEMPRYTGVLEARNFAVFQARLAAAGMAEQAAEFFHCSGMLARDCYQLELEAAMRTPHLAGFQLLDLQDFPGQGTALVGMLNAFLKNKGLLSAAEWRGFCGDCVLLARMHRLVWTAHTTQTIAIGIRLSRPLVTAQTLRWTLTVADTVCQTGTLPVPALPVGYAALGTLRLSLPADCVGRARLCLSLDQTDCRNAYRLTILPPVTPLPVPAYAHIAHTVAEALPLLQAGERVLLLPQIICKRLPAAYCTDFWCYPMFRTISESMQKPVPVGTLGLCIQAEHPIAKALWSDCYTTPQWYSPLAHADCAILDEAPAGYRPIVQMIDNVERNHRLGLLFEAKVANGSLLVCTIRLSEALDDPSMNRLAHGIFDYFASDAFAPTQTLSPTLLQSVFG